MFGRIRYHFERSRQKRRFQKWLRAVQINGAVVPWNLELRGDRSDYASRILIGRGTCLERDVSIWLASEAEADPSIRFGSRVYVGRNCYFGSFESIDIGDETIIGAYSYVISANHKSAIGMPVRDQGYDAAPILIGRDVWIGCHVVILPGVTIGDHAIIGAGAVVNRNVPAGEKWAGVPAKKIGTRA